MSGQVLIRAPQGPSRQTQQWPPERAWVVVGWIGVVLAAAALADYTLALVPPHFASMEWEFGTIGQVFAGLPLLSIGLAAIWISGAVSRRRWVLLSIGLALEVGAVILLVLLLAFALDIPVALKMNEGPAREPVVKLVVKTIVLGLLFGSSYVVSGVQALKQARGTPRGDAVT